MSNTRIHRRAVRMQMASGGRPSDDNRFADLYAAAVRAGLDVHQASALAAIAYDAAKLSDWKLTGHLQLLTRRRHAATHPRGKWAVLIARHGQSALFMDENDERAWNWAVPETARIQGQEIAIVTD